MLRLMRKKGISPLIGYVLLVSFVVIIGALVYQWLSTYVPGDKLECPKEVSIFFENVNCSSVGTNYILNITFKNNGLFSIAGYYIHSSDDYNKLATVDLSTNVVDKITMNNAVMFGGGTNNFLEPSNSTTHIFNLTSDIKSIEIMPIRWQTEKNKLKFVSCGEAKIKGEISCA